jgi:hypothetical protein
MKTKDSYERAHSLRAHGESSHLKELFSQGGGGGTARKGDRVGNPGRLVGEQQTFGTQTRARKGHLGVHPNSTVILCLHRNEF